MNRYHDKIILTDIDGVVLNWQFAFDIWMSEHGFKSESSDIYDISTAYNIPRDQGKKLVKIFNESAAVGFLPALRDSVYYIRRLAEHHGYEFHAITSLSSDINAQKLRKMNLRKLFGPDVFTKFVILDTGADKDEALSEYANSELFFIEDKPANCDAGLNAGLRSVLMTHGYNLHYNNSKVPVVHNWREIHDLVLGL